MVTPARDGGESTITWYLGGKRTVRGPDQEEDLIRCLDEGTLHEKAIRVFLSANCASAKEVRELLPKIIPRHCFNEAVVASLPKYNNNCYPALVKKYPKSLEKDYPTPKGNSTFIPNRKGFEAESTWTPSSWQINTIDDGPRGKLRDSEPEYIQRPEEYDFNNKLAAGLPDDEEDEDEGGAEVDKEEDEDRKMLRDAGADKNILDLLNNIGLLKGVIEIEVGIAEKDDHPWQGRKIYVAPIGDMLTVHAEATRALPNYQGSSFELAGFTYDPRSHKWRNNDPEASTPTKPKVSRADKLRAAKNKLDECQDTADESKQRLEEAETRVEDAATAVQNLKRARQEHKVAKAERDAMKAKHDQNMDALSVAEEEYKKARRQ